MTAIAPSVAAPAPLVDRRATLRRIEMHFGICMATANILGALGVFAFIALLLPKPQKFLDPNLIALVAYLLASSVVCSVVSARIFRPLHALSREEGPATAEQRAYVARHPLRQTILNFAIWVASLVVFVPINWKYGAQIDWTISSTILMGGIITCGLTYLMAERILRPVNEIAFAGGLPECSYVPGIKPRVLLAWAIGTGVPLVGVIMMACDHGARPISATGLTALGIDGILSGATAMLFAAKSIADPVGSVTRALADVEAGRLDIAVPVYDGSEIGRLQNGFNAMVEGLRERRQLRDLFGRQVGEDVARQAIERGVRLGGEQVHAAVLFVDVIGSTELAETRPPAEVVSALNAFFAVVVDVVDRTGGFVNKFEGDAALCVFGVPVPRDNPEDCALHAARLLCDRLSAVRGLSAAVGVSSGTVVAGNVGTRERFEYTVIGDAVNEAARLTELAKSRPDRVLVSASVVENASPSERDYWRGDGEILVRGRSTPTRLAVPA